MFANLPDKQLKRVTFEFEDDDGIIYYLWDGEEGFSDTSMNNFLQNVLAYESDYKKKNLSKVKPVKWKRWDSKGSGKLTDLP